MLINFENQPINPNYTYDINGIASLVNNYDGVVTIEPSDYTYTFLVPEEEVGNTLAPLIGEARRYLNARGLTNDDINIMIQEEGGQEVDLVAYAMVLSNIENGNITGMNFSNLFLNSAYAQDYVHCALEALGLDALYALGSSQASAWTKAAMKKAFGAVAKRFLGPVGVAIAVVSFGLCLNGVHL